MVRSAGGGTGTGTAEYKRRAAQVERAAGEGRVIAAAAVLSSVGTGLGSQGESGADDSAG